MFQAAKEFRIGRPQILAGLMLLAFLAQCLWVAASRQLSSLEIQYLASADESPELGAAYRARSPLTAWLAAAPRQVAAVSRSISPAWLRAALSVPRLWLIR